MAASPPSSPPSAWPQPEVGDLARKAATAASDAQPSSPSQALVIAEAELLAECVSARASLAQGRDADAFKAAQMVGGG